MTRLSQIGYTQRADLVATEAALLDRLEPQGLESHAGRCQKKFGTALLDVQYGEPPAEARPLRGFGGAGVLEIAEDYHTDTYRAVYTVSFPGTVYVLHVFQKKAKRGIRTPKREIAVIRRRHELARLHHAKLAER